MTLVRACVSLPILRCPRGIRVKREERREKREEGRGKREEGRGKREEGRIIPFAMCCSMGEGLLLYSEYPQRCQVCRCSACGHSKLTCIYKNSSKKKRKRRRRKEKERKEKVGDGRGG